jgi:uncharacterized protein (UPF0303 family)
MDKDRIETLIADIKAQEAELRFSAFPNSQAVALGMALVAKASMRGLPITVDVRRGSQQLFHCALEGTSADNDQWIIRKVRTVERFGHASFLVGLQLKLAGLSLEEKYCVSPLEFSAHGGSFPVHVVGTGIIGAVTVSGLPQEDDHNLVVECIREFLGKA